MILRSITFEQKVYLLLLLLLKLQYLQLDFLDKELSFSTFYYLNSSHLPLFPSSLFFIL